MPSLESLGKKVKSQYPQYQDMSDIELGRKVKSKFPEVYSEFRETESDITKEDFFKRNSQQLIDAVTGGAKGAGTALFNIGTLGQKAFGMEQTERPGFLEPTQRQESAFGGAQTGLFFTPGPAGKAGRFAQGTRFAGRARATARGAAVTGAEFGAKTAAVEGDTDKAIDAAILSSVFPVAGRVGGEIKGVIGPSSAERIINSLVRPLQRQMSYGKNPGRGVAEERIVANNLDDLTQKVDDARKSVGFQISRITQDASKKNLGIDVSRAFQSIDDALVQAKKAPRTNSTLIKRLQDTKKDLQSQLKGKDPKNLSPKDAFDLKQTIAEITKFTGNVSDDNLVNGALKGTYGRVKDSLNQRIPGLQNLNERYANLSSASVAAKHRQELAQRSGLLGFTARIGGVAGGAATIAGGNFGLGAVIGLSGFALERAMSSTAFKTRLAALLANSTPSQKEALFQMNPALKSAATRLFTETTEEE